MRTNKLIAAWIAAGLTFSLAACGGGSGGDAGDGGGTLSLGLTIAPGGQDIVGLSGPIPIFRQALYDSLLRQSPEGEIEPSLATDYEYSDDKLTLTMTLRSDVKFTDGSQLDAAAVKASLDRFKASTAQAAAALASLKAVEVVDPTTVKLTLTQPDPAMLVNLTGDAGAIGNPKSFTAPDVATKPAGSGPYLLDSGATVVGSKYVYTKNPDYWKEEDQHYDKLVLNVYDSGATILNALRGKQINGAQVSDNVILPQVKSAGYSTVNRESTWEGLIFLDRQGKLDKAVGNAKVRQAISHAFDREVMLKAVGKGYGVVTTQALSPVTGGFDETLDDAYPYDPAKGKQLLAEAGYPDGLTLTMPQLAAASATIWPLVSQYLKAIGITVKYEQVPASGTVGALLGGKYALSWVSLGGEPTVWQSARIFIGAGSPVNPFKVEDATVEGYLKQVRLGDAAAEKALGAHLVEQAWFAPWYRSQQHFALDSGTTAVMQPDVSVPSLWNIAPKA